MKNRMNVIAPVRYYKLICPVCGVEHEKLHDQIVPHFGSRVEVAEYAIADLGWSDGETLARAVARACKINGCGEAAFDAKFGRKSHGSKRARSRA